MTINIVQVTGRMGHGRFSDNLEISTAVAVPRDAGRTFPRPIASASYSDILDPGSIKAECCLSHSLLDYFYMLFGA